MSAFGAKTRACVLERDEHRCARCGTVTTQIQHRRPRMMGGTSLAWIAGPANGVLLCGSGTTGCHGYYESQREIARADGMLLGPNELPWEHAVWFERDGTWRQLNEDGTWTWTTCRDFLDAPSSPSPVHAEFSPLD